MGKERIVLEHDADPTLFRRQVHDAAAVQDDVAVVGGGEAGDDHQGCRLSRAGRAEEGHKLARGDLKRDVVDRRVLRTIAFRDVCDRQGGPGSPAGRYHSRRGLHPFTFQIGRCRGSGSELCHAVAFSVPGRLASTAWKRKRQQSGRRIVAEASSAGLPRRPRQRLTRSISAVSRSSVSASMGPPHTVSRSAMTRRRSGG